MRFLRDYADVARISRGAVLLAFGAALVPSGANAQDKKGEQSAWVKLCEAAPMRKRGKDGKVTTEKKNICLTHHERLDGNTGMVLVSAAIRKVEGNKNHSLMIMVPLGMALKPGLRAAVYNKDLWKKAQAKEKIDEKKLRPMSLNYTLCHPAGCTAEIKADDKLLKELRDGGGLMVLAINAVGKPVGFPVPLTGFSSAYDGKPVDNKLYARERGKLMAQIRERQKKLIEAARAKRKAATEKK
ncbi:MAG: invasion associated locus B family protein [Pseudomonadota bacterium]